jgi:hypothetical protein
MTYVLVSLPGDEASQEADRLARHLEKKLPPLCSFHEENPDHEFVTKDMSETKKGVFFGHNGNNALKSRRDDEPWVDGARLGNLSKDSRIYVYACKALEDSGFSLGDEAVKHGAAVVAGHDAPISSPSSDSGFTKEQLSIFRDAAVAMIESFLSGDNDVNALRDAGRKAYNALDEGGLLSLSPQGSGFMNAAFVQRRLFQSIKVLIRKQ